MATGSDLGLHSYNEYILLTVAFFHSSPTSPLEYSLVEIFYPCLTY